MTVTLSPLGIVSDQSLDIVNFANYNNRRCINICQNVGFEQ